MMNNQYNQGEDKIEAEDSKIKSPFLSWLENFWYYHKWHVLIGSFFVVVLVVLIMQSIKKEEPDMMLTFAGSYYLSPTEVTEIEKVVSDKYLAVDCNKDGKKILNTRRYEIYSEDEINALKKEGVTVSTVENSQNMNDYSTYMATGDSIIVILSGYLYESLVENERLVKVSEILGAESGKGEDVYGIRLADTALYRENEAISQLPENFYLCLMRQYVWGQSSHTDVYECAKSTFVNMVNGTGQ
ncbi:MAG: hypothetical protein IJR83_01045 [Clostridia bacterium]|nr:hypothetical protein [Clostridia bacterium]